MSSTQVVLHVAIELDGVVPSNQIRVDDAEICNASHTNIGEENQATALVLAPVDTGRQAWTFVAAASLLDVLMWGFPFS